MVKVFSILLLSAACAIASAGSIKATLRKPVNPGIHAIVKNDRIRWSNLKSDSKVVPATNELVSYYIDIELGTPAQKLSLLFDTGSSLLWVYDEIFKTSESSTAKDLKFANVLQYGSGNVTIEFYQDKASISGETFTQTFGVTKDISAIGVNGIIGFGPDDLAGAVDGKKTYNVPTPLDNLYAVHEISTKVVGVYFKPITNGGVEATNGEVDIGGVDSSKYKGKLNYIPLTKKAPASYYWGVDINQISFDTHVATTLKSGIVDTGTTLILLDQTILQSLFSTVGGTLDEATGLYIIPKGKISALKDITFTLGGKPFSLTPSQYIIPTNQFGNYGLTAGVHYTYFSPIAGEGLDAIIGQKFLENYYSVFDTTNNRVGLATRN